MSKKKITTTPQKKTKNPPASVTNTLWQHQMPTTTTKNGARRYTGENVHCGFFVCFVLKKQHTGILFQQELNFITSIIKG